MSSHTCIFCRGPVADPNEEHVIPASFGGTVTIPYVCRSCNSRLGQDVDSVTNDEFIQSVREEAGLRTRKTIRAKIADRDSAGIAVHLRPNGGYVVPTQVVRNDDGTSTIIADTPEIAQTHAERMQQVTRDRGRSEEFGEATVDPPRVQHVEIAPSSTVPLHRQLDRLGCKIALDFIALVAGPSVALDPRLDELRTGALEGGVENGQGDVLPAEAEVVYLPRTRRLFPLQHRSEETRLSAADLYSRFVSEDGSLLEGPPALHNLDNIFHEVRVLRDDSRGLLQIILFGLLFLEVEVPRDLQLPWGHAYKFKIKSAVELSE